MTQRLALFDLDNTLLNGDSDHAWGEFLIERGLVSAKSHAAANDAFYRQYEEGTLNIHDYVRFTLAPVLKFSQVELVQMHQEFTEKFVLPMVLPAAVELVNRHLSEGDYCVIITATNSFVTSPIAQMFGVDKLIATELELIDGHYTGEISGIPCFQEGKVQRMSQWLNAMASTEFSLENSIFYSDSINDLPLLKLAGQAIAVDPDKKLKLEADKREWKCLSLR
ncbi:MAG: HAD family hydrolase [Pseudohongiellaceae bacterium]